MRLRTRIASAVLALSMVAGSGAAVMAAPNQTNGGGAAGVVAAVVQALNNINVTNNTVDVAIVQLNNSLNNLTALNNVLNNSPILSNITVTIGDINVIRDSLNNVQVTALNDFLNNSLNNVDVNALVGVVVLGGQDLLLLTR